MWPDLWRALANRNPCNKCCKRVYIYIYRGELGFIRARAGDVAADTGSRTLFN